jgi:hypothetical protein
MDGEEDYRMKHDDMREMLKVRVLGRIKQGLPSSSSKKLLDKHLGGANKEVRR